MRKFKGIELPVNSVIVIALAIFVLLMLASFFGKSGGEMDRTLLQSSFNQACSQVSSSYNCDPTKISAVKSGYVVGGTALSFLEVCRNYLNDMGASEDKCVKSCPQCGNSYAVSGSACPKGDDDCKSPYGAMKCMSGICCATGDTVVDGHCQSGTNANNPNDCTGQCTPACVSPLTCKKVGTLCICAN